MEDQTAMTVPNGAKLRVTEITEPAALTALAPQWRALFDRAPDASPFQTPEWLLAWRAHFLGAGLWTLAFRREGRLVALAPMFIHPRADGLRQVTLLGNGVSDRLDLLAEPEARGAAAAAVFDHLAARRDLWDLCDFRDLPADSPLLGAPLGAAGMDRIEPEEPCPTLPLPSAPEKVSDGLPQSRRADLARCARRLAETEHSFEQATCETLAENLRALIALHEARWAARGGGMFAEPKMAAFHLAAAAGLLARGLLRLCVLKREGRIIAAHYGLIRGATAYSYLHGFDPGCAHFGPGRLLLRQVLEEAVREGARDFNFLRGREAYKYEWGASDRAQFRRRIWA